MIRRNLENRFLKTTLFGCTPHVSVLPTFTFFCQSISWTLLRLHRSCILVMPISISAKKPVTRERVFLLPILPLITSKNKQFFYQFCILGSGIRSSSGKRKPFWFAFQQTKFLFYFSISAFQSPASMHPLLGTVYVCVSKCRVNLLLLF